ncbi:MAG: aspartate-semialdehyde dehydrogenase [Thomasclavelia sp.]|nr:aspartate-semialdehyde dehydrogenase [Thomasclavelia sp.]
MKKYHVAIVGATGAVGREMLRCLYQFNFPFEDIKLLASARSKGKEIEFDNDKYVVDELTENSFEGIDIAFWSAGGSISAKYMEYAVKAGCVNIDNTSHFRMDKDVPLVVPEVNGEALKNHKGIIACPNCTTIMMCSALKRINDEFDIERIVVSTYQAVSGAGVAGMEELYRQSKDVMDGKEPEAKTLPCGSDKKHYPIAFNCLPQVDKFDLDNHYSKEELKMVNETKKIFSKDIEVNATCVRVPVLRGHSESIYIETKKNIDIDKVFDLLGNSTGIDLYDDLANQIYPYPTKFIGDELTHVGRVRKDLYKDNALSLWITGDQLMKGAAYNSVDIGLKMIELGLL